MFTNISSSKSSKDIILSICITTYNRWEKLYKCLQKILAQQNDFCEILIVDDFSRDPCPSKVKCLFNIYNIKYIRNKINLGLASSRNVAINASRGKFITFCDDDDLWPDNLISDYFTVIEKSHNDIFLYFDEKKKNYFKKRNIKLENLRLKDVFKCGITPPGSSQVYRLNLISGCRYNPQINSGVDHDLWIRLLDKNPNLDIIFGPRIIYNNNLLDDRITTNEKRRKAGILISLEIWKHQIIDNLGNDFYIYFKNSYVNYLWFFFEVKKIKTSNLYILRFIFRPYLAYRFLKILARQYKQGFIFGIYNC